MLIVFFLLLNVALIYFLKYKYQGVSISEFELTFPGNLLNLFIPLLLIVLVILLKYRSPKIFEKYLRLFFIISISCIALPLVTVFIKVTSLVPETPYMFSQPFDRVLVGALFSLTYLLLMFASSVAYLGLYKNENLLLLKTFSHTLMYGLLLILFSFLYMTIFSYSSKQLIGKTKSSLAVVLGAAVWSGNKASNIHKSRLDKAAQFYFNKQVSKILLTGGNAPGEKSEAMIGYEYLIEKGIPAKDLLMEENTSSTTEQISYLKNSIVRNKKFRNIVVISNSFHLARINEIRKFYKIDFKLAGAEIKLSQSKQIYYKLREGIALHFFWLFGI